MEEVPTDLHPLDAADAACCAAQALNGAMGRGLDRVTVADASGSTG